MKTYEIKAYGKTYNVHPTVNKYQSNGTLAISLITDSGEPFANLTVNIMDTMIWGNDTTAFVDVNNCEWAENFIAKNELGEYMGIIGRSGFCTYPLYKFDIEKIMEG